MLYVVYCQRHVPTQSKGRRGLYLYTVGIMTENLAVISTTAGEGREGGRGREEKEPSLPTQRRQKSFLCVLVMALETGGQLISCPWLLTGTGQLFIVFIARLGQCYRRCTVSKKVQVANAIIVVAPYRYQGTLVFDDESVALNKERFAVLWTSLEDYGYSLWLCLVL